MNERIKELILEAGFVGYGEDLGSYNIPAPAFNSRMEKFAELIVKECADVARGWTDIYVVEDNAPRQIDEFMIQHFGVE